MSWALTIVQQDRHYSQYGQLQIGIEDLAKGVKFVKPRMIPRSLGWYVGVQSSFQNNNVDRM